jgi:hypothetical protein
MPEITGRLLADLHPNGTVRMVFIAHTGGGNEAPLRAKTSTRLSGDRLTSCQFPIRCGVAARASRIPASADEAIPLDLACSIALTNQFNYQVPRRCCDG